MMLASPKVRRDIIKPPRPDSRPRQALGLETRRFAAGRLVARFHRGALPTRRHKTLRDLLPDEQKATIQLAAVLRLANALDAAA